MLTTLDGTKVWKRFRGAVVRRIAPRRVRLAHLLGKVLVVSAHDYVGAAAQKGKSHAQDKERKKTRATCTHAPSIVRAEALRIHKRGAVSSAKLLSIGLWRAHMIAQVALGRLNTMLIKAQQVTIQPTRLPQIAKLLGDELPPAVTLKIQKRPLRKPQLFGKTRMGASASFSKDELIHRAPAARALLQNTLEHSPLVRDGYTKSPHFKAAIDPSQHLLTFSRPSSLSSAYLALLNICPNHPLALPLIEEELDPWVEGLQSLDYSLSQRGHSHEPSVILVGLLLVREYLSRCEALDPEATPQRVFQEQVAEILKQEPPLWEFVSHLTTDQIEAQINQCTAALRTTEKPRSLARLLNSPSIHRGEVTTSRYRSAGVALLAILLTVTPLSSTPKGNIGAPLTNPECRDWHLAFLVPLNMTSDTLQFAVDNGFACADGIRVSPTLLFLGLSENRPAQSRDSSEISKKSDAPEEAYWSFWEAYLLTRRMFRDPSLDLNGFEQLIERAQKHRSSLLHQGLRESLSLDEALLLVSQRARGLGDGVVLADDPLIILPFVDRGED